MAAEAGGLDPVAEDGTVERVARRVTDNEVVKLERRGVARERRLLRLEAGAVSRSRVARARGGGRARGAAARASTRTSPPPRVMTTAFVLMNVQRRAESRPGARSMHTACRQSSTVHVSSSRLAAGRTVMAVEARRSFLDEAKSQLLRRHRPEWTSSASEW